MKQHRYLVTAAAGKTGVHTVRQLLAGGHAVRAMVRTEDERSAALRDAGAEVVAGDLLDYDDVLRALDGTTAAYLCYPVRPGLVQATAYFAAAARRFGLDVVVNMSQISAREDAKSKSAQNHWIAERVLDWSGVPVVHLRPTFFSEWLTFPWVRDLIVGEGRINLPYGDGRHAPIAAEDQARTIAALLANPGAHAGKTYALRGPVEFSQAELAAELTRLLGRTVEYRPDTLQGYREHLQKYGLPEFMVQHFCEIALDYRNGIFAGTDDAVGALTGTPPQTVAQFVDANRAAFE